MAFDIWMGESSSGHDVGGPVRGKNRWRVSAVLATAAVFGSIGVIGWAAGSMVDLNSDRAAVEPSSQSFGSAPSTDAAALPSHDEYVAAVVKSQAGDASTPDAQSTGWQDGRDWLAQGSATALVDAPKPAPKGDQLAVAVPAPETDVAAPQTADLRAIAPYPSVPLQNPKHFRREHKAEQAHVAAPKFHRLASRATFLEKTVEQGDTGAVSFRYRRRDCTPPNMVDVCFMPAENRRKIVVEHY